MERRSNTVATAVVAASGVAAWAEGAIATPRVPTMTSETVDASADLWSDSTWVPPGNCGLRP